MQRLIRMKALFKICLIVSQIIIISSSFATTTQHITETYTDIMRFVLSQANPAFKQEVPVHFERIFKKEFSTLLKMRFSTDELKTIDDTIQKVGGKNIVRISQVLIDVVSTKLHPKEKLDDFQLVLSPGYNEVLEKICKEKKVMERLKSLYVAYNTQKKIEIHGGDPEQFATIAIKHLKKAVADHFTEDQFCTWHSFDHSELSKRVNDILAETIVFSMAHSKKE